MKLVLIRHGRTEANEKHLYCGSTDIPLSESGRAELAALRDELSLPDPALCRLYTSGMKRTDETLEILFGAQPFEGLPDFREMDLGAFEMRSYEEMKDEEAYQAWISGDNEANRTPGGESGNEMTARVLKALQGLVSEDDDAVLVTHGGPIAAVMAALFPEEGKNRYEWQPAAGRGYVVTLTDGEKTYEAL